MPTCAFRAPLEAEELADRARCLTVFLSLLSLLELLLRLMPSSVSSSSEASSVSVLLGFRELLTVSR